MDVLELIEPAAPVVALPEAKAFLRLTDEDTSVINDDSLIASLIVTATAYLDGENGYLGRALGRQRYRLRLDAFPRDGIEVPLPPLHSIDLIRYVQPDGTTADLSPFEFRVAIPGAAPGLIRSRSLWPPTLREPGSIVVEFTAGYETVPRPIRTAIMQHVALLYENRETAAYGTASFQTVPFAGLDLVQPYRRWVL